MKKLLIYMDEERHEDLKELAHRKKTTMAGLVRFAIEEVFEDELDVIAGERGLDESLTDASATITLDEYIERRGLELHDSNAPAGRARSRSTARTGS